jgi:cell division protein FtsA
MGKLTKLFRFGSDPGDVALSLDIGTDLVKALIIRGKEGKGEVIGVGYFKQRLSDMQAGMVTDIEGVVENCQDAIDEAVEQAKVEPKQVIVGIAGEFVKGATTIVHYQRTKPGDKIDMKELETIVQKVQWRAFDQVRQQLAKETGYQEVEVKLVNAAIVDVQIDGYQVTNPLGFQGRDVSVGIFNAFAPMVHLGALQTITEDLDLDLLSIAAEPYAVARSIGREEAGEFSAIFLDIGGGTTDLALVRNGGVVGTKMFALGGRAFTKRLSAHFNVTFEKAEEMKLNYSKGEVDATSGDMVKQILEPDAHVWMSGVELVLSDLAKSEHLPSRILLCGGGSALPEIKKVLEAFDWQKHLPFTRDPKISFIQPKDVTNISDTTGKLTTSQDVTPMALANLALDLIGKEKLVGKMLRQAVKAMQA